MGPFSEHFRVIRYDVRGIGRSTLTERAAAYSNRQDLRDLLAWPHVERAHLVGASVGGSLAIDFALDCPRLVSSLVRVAPRVSGHASVSWIAAAKNKTWRSAEATWMGQSS